MPVDFYHIDKSVREFYDVVGWPSFSVLVGLFNEELQEFEKEKSNDTPNIPNLIKEACDCLYTIAPITYTTRDMLYYKLIMEIAQTFHEFKIPLCILIPAFDLVHENNMSKIKDGVIRNEAGKIMKPVSYKPVDLTELVKEYIDVSKE